MPFFFRQPWIWFSIAVMTGVLLGCGGGSGDASTAGSGGTGSVSVLAGQIGGSGYADGTGTATRFHNPQGIASDAAGNMFVADTNNNTIRRITPAGVVTTLAGNMGMMGSTDGTGTAASFAFPKGIAIDGAGNVYVADTGNHLVRKITSTGMVTTLAGTAGMSGSADGTGAAARFNNPEGIAVDSAGNVLVADMFNFTIRKITPAGVVTTLAGTAGAPGLADGTGAAARFDYPEGLVIDSADNVLVADTFNFSIRKITPAGVVTTFAGVSGSQGSIDGSAAAARFNYSQGLAIDGIGNLFVADTNNFTIRKITPSGVVTTLAGTAGLFGSTDGSGAAARFNSPKGLAADSAGNVFVTDMTNNTIRKIDPAGVVTTFAGAVETYGATNGPGTMASFSGPQGIAVDNAGNVFVADTGSLIIRKITSGGVVTTFAGAIGIYGITDGAGAAASFLAPAGLATDSAGNVFVVDAGGSTIRKITPTGVVTTFAGTALALLDSVDGIGAAARFNNPHGIAADSSGNVFVADTDNHTIRKITPAGVVTTFAGMASVSGSADGTGVAARFGGPRGIATDSRGNVFVADTGNSSIRKITPAGVVTTLAGTVYGTGAVAHFGYPEEIATDGAGNVFVVDADKLTIRKITPAGMVTTIAGITGVAGVVPGPLPTSLNRVTGIAIDHNGMLYVTAENAVLKIVLP